MPGSEPGLVGEERNLGQPGRGNLPKSQKDRSDAQAGRGKSAYGVRLFPFPVQDLDARIAGRHSSNPTTLN
jgi:hypothetical protein